ncbi:recombinase family protein [Streptomyces sp. 6N223]|uniref:recombinase family protein n=1 Tax=Streptomyces sp. 6N223 TaxID=3457412 RepID=UPI003FD21012
MQLWVPELGGLVDPKAAGHEELMILLGILSKREIARTRMRVRSAMTVQARDQGRYLGASAEKWRLTAVRAILANPRCTGRQVWNRQRTDHELLDPENTSLGHRDVMRWNTPRRLDHLHQTSAPRAGQRGRLRHRSDHPRRP